MTILKTLSVMAVLSTVVAAPVLARDAGSERHRGPAHHGLRDQHFRGAYNQRNEFFGARPQFQENTEDFGGRDRSRIGGEDPDLHPSAY